MTKGIYNVIGTIDDPIETNGQVTINLSNAEIDMSAADAPAISVKSGSLSLALTGESTVRGGDTWAGIYVAPGAALNISGAGELSAFGGMGLTDQHGLGAGSGIGGNGIDYHNKQLYREPSFGTVTIEESTVNATGGDAGQYNAGAGAGIGSGGLGGVYSNKAFSLQGMIVVKSGTVNANGGKAGDNTADTLGGAGIGSGGLGNGDASNCDNQVTISILGGTIKANGGNDGAGIGGGANCNSGKVIITGGDVEAHGGHETDGIYGGAGIGGGDMSCATDVEIGGNALVKAFGGGSAAGIGGGQEGTLDGKIDIAGSAKVWAHGGTAYNSKKIAVGGAGIGAGAGRNTTYKDCGEISITENAYVRAYAGKCAQAIGAGSYYANSDGSKTGSYLKTLKLRDNIDIWMFNQDDVQPAFWGQNEDGETLDSSKYTADGLITAWYTDPEGGTFPADDTQQITRTYPKQENIFWKKLGKTIEIYRVANPLKNDAPRFEPGNWGTLIKPITPEKPEDPGQPGYPEQSPMPDQPPMPDVPQTGDNSNLLLWALLMAGACAAWICCKKAAQAH